MNYRETLSSGCETDPMHLSEAQKSSFLHLRRTYWTISTLNQAPCNFWLFSKIEIILKEAQFRSRDERRQNVTKELSNIPKFTSRSIFGSGRNAGVGVCKRKLHTLNFMRNLFPNSAIISRRPGKDF
ncbi:hypothetical protein TNCV_2147461 [Trichonephila clavipes]|uniref:Uncharacterized protein n=1 Tax=Trichonephila clavipes TaxID=2585209 RepID=A0A8X6SYP1_TRICX|nr:hypothetical protein TNCV_2147461 [Trichonephila clavipes]